MEWRWVGVGVEGVSILLQCFDFETGVKISWKLNFSHTDLLLIEP